jgi:hypothetical protein
MESGKDISQLLEEYKKDFVFRKQLKSKVSELNKSIKKSEASILKYLQDNKITKIPVTIDDKTFYISIKNSVDLK